jgi:hypothetical protein
MALRGRSWARAGLDEAAYAALAVGLAASELWSLLLGVKILADPARRILAERVATTVGAPVVLETLTHDYYDGLRFMISARCSSGEHLPLIDGGSFDWLRKLTSNHKLIFVASALGSQLAAHLYRSRAIA